MLLYFESHNMNEYFIFFFRVLFRPLHLGSLYDDIYLFTTSLGRSDHSTQDLCSIGRFYVTS